MSHATPILDFVTGTLDRLLDRNGGQCLRWGGNWNNPFIPTVSRPVVKRYVSAGGILPDGTMERIHVETVLPDKATRLDIAMIEVLERVSRAGGKPVYAELAAHIDGLLGVYGFDPMSGLPYVSTECDIDVRLLGPGEAAGGGPPRFKFKGDMLLDRLWRVAPDKMVRAARSAYHGLITNPDTFDFNRYCHYGWDDAEPKHQLAFDPWHVGFASSAAWMVRQWAFVYAKTGDAQLLAWATKMTDKWAALQSPRTGLVPHFLGAKMPEDKTQTVQTYCHHRDLVVAEAWLEAADFLAARPGGAATADTLRKMALALARGIAKYAYDMNLKFFYNWMNVADAAPASDTIIYTFFSQAQKEHWVGRDPTLGEVAVCPGVGFYLDPAPWAFFRGADVESMLAKVALRTGDVELTNRLVVWAREFIYQREALVHGPILEDGRWSYAAAKSNIDALLALFRLTGKREWLSAAKRVATREIEFLARPEAQGKNDLGVAWWAFPQRSGLLASMLDLHDALGA
ncbi:MAG: hypothetical protein NTW19_14270 [Planctomycetota bacterium]|nr:hypothetical protein [Planctomycetota bacterium]